MICPHCQLAIHDERRLEFICDLEGKTISGRNWWAISRTKCPECFKMIFDLVHGHAELVNGTKKFTKDVQQVRVFPKGASKPPAPSEVPVHLATDYNEAALILSDSPKASAALSRRCLQNIIHDTLQIKERDLAKEIDAVLAQRILPSHLADSIDAIRAVGNYAAHPVKATACGSILEVEPGEAEWSLDLLEGLFDFLFVEPAKTQKRKDAVNAKLVQAGKPQIKT